MCSSITYLQVPDAEVPAPFCVCDALCVCCVFPLIGNVLISSSHFPLCMIFHMNTLMVSELQVFYFRTLYLGSGIGFE